MNLVNSTNLAAGHAPGRMKNGQMCLVMAAKATYDFPEQSGGPLKLAKEQAELLDEDVYSADPETSPPSLENDYAPFKPRCDIIVHACAYAPGGEPIERIRVGAIVGDWQKQFDVVGNRYWLKGLAGWKPSSPEPFVKKELSWMSAYGGIDEYKEGQAEYCMLNPAGVGFWHKLNDRLNGMPVPNTEQADRPIKMPGGNYIPQGFGPIGRHWEPRRQYAGTYDEKWEAQKAPFLPDDFDEQFYQCAPADQQVAFLKGGESIYLHHLTEEAALQFQLPDKLTVVMSVIKRGGQRVSLNPCADTLIIDAEQKKLSVVWRAHIPLKIGTKEVEALLVGRPTPGWERARLTGKTYVPMARLNQFKAVLKDEADE